MGTVAAAEEPEKIKKRIRDAANQSITNIIFTGSGEMTLEPELPNYIGYAKTLGFRDIRLETNGIKFSDKDYARSLKESGLTSIAMSVPSHMEEIYETITQTPGSFVKYKLALQNIGELGIKFVANNPIINLNYSFEHFLRLMNFLNSYSLEPLIFSPRLMRPYCGEGFEMQFMPRYEEVATEIVKISKYCEEKKIKLNLCPAFSIPSCLCPGFENQLLNLRKETCSVYEFFKKVEGCNGCILYNRCVGISKFYETKYPFTPKPYDRFPDSLDGHTLK